MNVGEFITRHPQFEFDLEEYILSTKYVNVLWQRFQQFLEARHSRNSQEQYKARILSTVRKELCHMIPAYKRYNDIEDLAILPLIDKDSIRANPEGFVSSAFRAHELWQKNTSGTTGSPVTIQYTPEFYFELLLLSVRKIAASASVHDINRTLVFWMPCRFLCNEVQREDAKLSPDRAFGIFPYLPLHNIRDGIRLFPYANSEKFLLNMVFIRIWQC